MAEWFRRWTRNPLGSPRVGSNPARSDAYLFTRCDAYHCSLTLFPPPFRFPPRACLLLGNEREGIPHDLLSLMDCCVEIPQCGVVRSLNVHVSGAIALWQFAKEHNFKDDK